MGCCLSKKPSSTTLSSGSDVKSPDPVKPDVNKATKPVIELPVKPVTEVRENPEGKPTILEKVEKEEEEDVLDRKKRKSEEGSKAVVVRTSSCTKEEVDAILIQCGKLSRSNSAAKTRRYSGSKRSFDFDQNERTHGGGGDVEEEGRETPQRNRVERANGSPRERRRRTPTPSRERERGVSRSPGKRSEQATTNPSGSLVISSNIKFVTVPATDPSSKRITTVKRSIGEACRTAATSTVQPPPPPLPRRSSPRKAEQSPYSRRKPLREIDQNATKGDKKTMIKRGNESAAYKKLMKPQVISRSRSLRRSRDFDFSPETLLLLQSSEEGDKISSYTELLLKDIKNFNGKSSEDPLSSFNMLPSCVTKACSIVEAVEDLNSNKNTCLSSDLSQFRFTSSVVKKAEPSFEKYVTVRRGGRSLEEQESSCGGSNNLT